VVNALGCNAMEDCRILELIQSRDRGTQNGLCDIAEIYCDL